MPLRRWLRHAAFAVMCSIAVTPPAESGDTGGGCPAPASLPDTQPGRMLADTLGRYNAGALQDPFWRRLWDVYGPVEPCAVRDPANPAKAFVWTRGLITKGNLGLSVALTPKGEFDGFSNVMGIHPEHPGALSPLSVGALVREVDSYFAALARADYFSGVVLIARQDRPLFTMAYGPASIRYGVPNRLDTRFAIASVTKTLTALAIAQLAEQGRLAYTDTIRRHLPDYPSAVADKVTIHQLLSHTSGIGRSDAHEEGLQSKLIRSVAGWLPLTVAKPDFEPGTDVRYSNEAYTILGAIVEHASGMDYFDYVRTHIYAPAGMTDSGAFDLDEEVPNVASAYTRWRWTTSESVAWESGPRRMSVVRVGLKGSPAGSTYSTAADLLRLSLALRANRLVKADTLKLMTTTHVEMEPYTGAAFAEAYGYGFELYTLHGVRYVGKSGGTHGSSARFDTYPDVGFTVVVLSNYDSIANLVADYLGDLVVRAAR